MKKVIMLIFCIVSVILCLIVFTIRANKIIAGTYSDPIIISLIGSLTAIATVFSSIYLNSENARQQRASEVRKMKQDYYHKFKESFLLRLTYITNQNSKEFIEADKTFCIERNRLPLYASQEIIEYVDKVASGKLQNADFKTLFEIMRMDLKNEQFDEFKNLKELSVTLPAQATRLGSNK
jgi:hypothetical protein